MRTFPEVLRESNSFETDKEIEDVVSLMSLILQIDPKKRSIIIIIFIFYFKPKLNIIFIVLRATAKDALLATPMFEIKE